MVAAEAAKQFKNLPHIKDRVALLSRFLVEGDFANVKVSADWPEQGSDEKFNKMMARCKKNGIPFWKVVSEDDKQKGEIHTATRVEEKQAKRHAESEPDVETQTDDIKYDESTDEKEVVRHGVNATAVKFANKRLTNVPIAIVTMEGITLFQGFIYDGWGLTNLHWFTMPNAPILSLGIKPETLVRLRINHETDIVFNFGKIVIVKCKLEGENGTEYRDIVKFKIFKEINTCAFLSGYPMRCSDITPLNVGDYVALQSYDLKNKRWTPSLTMSPLKGMKKIWNDEINNVPVWETYNSGEPGDSGAPVIDPQGSVVGIHCGGFRDQGTPNFFIPFTSQVRAWILESKNGSTLAVATSPPRE